MFAEVDSYGNLDTIDEDVLRSEERRATGYIGKCSELHLLRDLQQNAKRPQQVSSRHEMSCRPPDNSAKASLRHTDASRISQQQDPTPTPISASTFYLDDTTMIANHVVNPFELPPQSKARSLMDAYLSTVQDSYPILSEGNVKDLSDQYCTSLPHGTPSAVSTKQLTILNLVFAIGSKAWVIMGFSVRYAQALGLHVRNEDQTTSAYQKETLLRLWWGLYSLEGLLSTILGRPSFVRESCCSAPLPLPLATEQLSNEVLNLPVYQQIRAGYTGQDVFLPASATSDPTNAGSYLKSKVRVDMIMQKAMTQLYSNTVITKSWRDAQLSISSLLNELEAWSISLPFAMNFARGNTDTSFLGARLRLQMHYIGAKILITRPCLCRFDSRTATRPRAPDNFTKQTAQACVGAAKEMVDLFPDHSDFARTSPDA
ncbi:hypothetical protein DM02DRAFT_635376 [Periconia macrospinosa]|uniref:Xylanolytic transcriptional activator regulatory domain-containing protein n=1 Tax=Periconia macrospinosa TaxID=97972 RepID=A0A2V1D459_9PLEO|nr:hypothetical protein DM02DRAFT_635376 [Periconia macrospinosa]